MLLIALIDWGTSVCQGLYVCFYSPSVVSFYRKSGLRDIKAHSWGTRASKWQNKHVNEGAFDSRADAHSSVWHCHLLSSRSPLVSPKQPFPFPSSPTLAFPLLIFWNVPFINTCKSVHGGGQVSEHYPISVPAGPLVSPASVPRAR